jgi:hypothetical protein
MFAFDVLGVSFFVALVSLFAANQRDSGPTDGRLHG